MEAHVHQLFPRRHVAVPPGAVTLVTLNQALFPLQTRCLMVSEVRPET